MIKKLLFLFGVASLTGIGGGDTGNPVDADVFAKAVGV